MIIFVSLFMFHICVLFYHLDLTKVFSFVTFVQNSLYPKGHNVYKDEGI
jgi:hypothetical protein